MASTRVFTGLVIVAALAAVPVSADQDRRRSESDRGRERSAEQADRGRQRAVPRAQRTEPQGDRRQQPDERRDQGQYQAQRQNQAQRQFEAQRQYDVQRQREADRRYDTRRYGRPSYSNRAYIRPRIAPRIIRPTIVTVVPYRPYVYRPSLGLGVYYGAGGSYPYGRTPRGYYDPIPGRPYGGLRITGAPREAHVFADGYYVGIVNDFDGMFQHLNLEAGGHRIEIEVPGYETIAFDVMVQPGRTVTFRADVY